MNEKSTPSTIDSDEEDDFVSPKGTAWTKRLRPAREALTKRYGAERTEELLGPRPTVVPHELVTELRKIGDDVEQLLAEAVKEYVARHRDVA